MENVALNLNLGRAPKDKGALRQPFNQSVSPSMTLPIRGPTDPSANRPTHQLTNQHTRQSFHYPRSHSSTNQPTNPLALRINDRPNDRPNERTNERTDERTNELVNTERTNEQTTTRERPTKRRQRNAAWYPYLGYPRNLHCRACSNNDNTECR